jgi:secreted PhoX family phosphatase
MNVKTSTPHPPSDPAPFDRRELLRFLGLGAAAGTLPSCVWRSAAHGERSAFVDADGSPSWTPLSTPLPTGGQRGAPAAFEVRDELLLPAGFVAEPLALWGEDFAGPDGRVEFGYNADFIGIVPLAGSRDEFFVVVNHEYISARPWLQGYEQVKGRKLPLDWRDDSAAQRELSRLALADLGVTILHCRQRADGGFEVLRDSRRHRRISGVDPRTPTHNNCSGCVTPWGSVLSCEENFQDYVNEFVDAAGEALARQRKPFGEVGRSASFAEPLEFEGLGACLEAPQDGRDFGWVCSVDPAFGELCKLRSLGRFRHENVALRCEPGLPLAAYMGDDRRGGHVWKFVSAQAVERVDDPANARLLESGALFAARMHEGGTGEWLALDPNTPLVRPEPQHLGGGHLWLPDRRLDENGRPRGGHVAVGAPGARHAELSAQEWVQSIERFCGKDFERCTLGDLVFAPGWVTPQARREFQLRVLQLDAYAFANAIGATPSARPEDLELHPHDGSVFIACSDAVSTSKDGSPDVRVFPGARANDSRRYGVIVRLEELGGAPDARAFRWSPFVSSGELHEGGLGLACPDNLAFDREGNLWVLTDMPGASVNGAVSREGASAPGTDGFVGVFGSSALYMIPTRGPRAGQAHCFALGPAECELCGVTFSPDGRTLLLAVQHPGEQNGTRGRSAPTEVERELLIADAQGTLVRQVRKVPLGSNWPARELGQPPRPGVVCIRRV